MDRLLLDQPDYSLFEPVDRQRGDRGRPVPSPEGLTYQQLADFLDVTIREAGVMEARCLERLRAMRGKYGRMPRFGTEEYSRFRRDVEKDDPRWRTAVAESDWQRAISELRHFEDMRTRLQREADQRPGAKPRTFIKPLALSPVPVANGPEDITDEEIPF